MDSFLVRRYFILTFYFILPRSLKSGNVKVPNGSQRFTQRLCKNKPVFLQIITYFTRILTSNLKVPRWFESTIWKYLIKLNVSSFSNFFEVSFMCLKGKKTCGWQWVFLLTQCFFRSLAMKPLENLRFLGFGAFPVWLPSCYQWWVGKE